MKVERYDSSGLISKAKICSKQTWQREAERSLPKNLFDHTISGVKFEGHKRALLQQEKTYNRLTQLSNISNSS